MRILYVTGLWNGLVELFTGGHDEPGAVPAFLHPLRELVHRGHEIDFVVACPDETVEVDIGTPWLQDARVHLVEWNVEGLHRWTAPARALGICRRIAEVLDQGDYDVVYGHGTFGVLGNVVANRRDVPCGMRLYGTFLAHELEQKSALRVALEHPFEALAYRLPKRFLISTDDGQCADRVHQVYTRGRDPYAFHFPVNGVRPASEVPTSTGSGPFDGMDGSGPVVFYPASIVRWKRQHLAVDLLARLDELGLQDARLALAGHLIDETYWDEVRDQARAQGLLDRVHYIGMLDTPAIYRAYREADTVLTMYWLSNMGNVLLEALSAGAVVAALDDGLVSLERIVTPGEHAVLETDQTVLAKRVHQAITDPAVANRLRDGARRRAAEVFPTWRERARWEADIVESAVAPNSQSSRPTNT